MIRIVFSLLFLTCFLSVTSQEIIFSQDVKSDTVRPERGPNLKRFRHPFFSFSFPITLGEEADFIKQGSSSMVDAGLRMKHKINNTFSAGLDIGLNWASYKIRQNDDKTVTDTIINDKEKIQINSLTPAIYLRMNAGKRGNFIGNFLDLGLYGSWNWKRAHITVNSNDDGEKIKVITTGLTYIEPISYGALARIGMNRYVITARYRLSDLFKSSVTYPELPGFSIGFEFGLFK